MLKLSPAFLLLLTACDPSQGATDRRLSSSGQLIAMSGGPGGAANACFTCHGLNGEGDGISVPRLAGLDHGYLQKQMEDYASGLRADPVMTPVAKKLSQHHRRLVAEYYARLPSPAPAAAFDRLPTPSLWTEGDSQRGIVACEICHGPNGEGRGGQPAVAAQPPAYTIEQIERFQSGDRRNDPRGVMATAVHRLTDEETRMIAAWLASRPAAASPETAGSIVERAVARPAGTREVVRPARSDGD